ncbi:hypothetical protein C8R43DRAFT_945073 [Mycena crocata]|nr:hypothetical protein C8R43DRAFT_945073 [Mycena crocata]
MSSPPAKRQRTENAPITRSELWHSDGSVVLQAEDTQFRVHWSVLSRNSSFFRDMQGLPQPPDQPSIDGCPVVELPDVKADVEYLLTALYIPTFLVQQALPLPAVAALIRLGRKYEFRDLLDLAVERLKTMNGQSYTYRPMRILDDSALRFDMLTLARENQILSVLPCAYYRAMIHDQALWFDGIPRNDGTVATLAQIDQRLLVIGREKVLNAQVQDGRKLTFGWFHSWEYDRDCNNSTECVKFRAKSLRKYMQKKTFFALQSVWKGTSLCGACRNHMQEAMAAGREKIWEELPGLFDLPPWDESKDNL